MNYKTNPKDSSEKSSQPTTDSSRTPSPDQLLKMQSARITQLEQEKTKMTARIKELEDQLKEQSKGISMEDLSALSGQLNEAISKTVTLNDKQLEYQSERIRDAVSREIKNIHIPRPNIPHPPFWWYIEPYVLIGVAVFSFFFFTVCVWSVTLITKPKFWQEWMNGLPGSNGMYPSLMIPLDSPPPSMTAG